MGFEELDEGCIGNMLCHTTPADACRLSLVSKIFRSAAKSDFVWDHFLPSDYQSVISQSVSFIPPASRKDLYLALSDSHSPVIIDHGKKSFHLDRRGGKKCYMLAARDLCIIWGDTPQYWGWTILPESRFQEVAQLHDVCWLEIRGNFSTRSLSSNTQYAAYLVFKMIDDYGFDYHPVELSVGIHGGHSSTKKVCLDPHLEENRPHHRARRLHRRVQGLQRPNERSDGWWEIEMGEFFNSDLEDEEVEMSVKETRGLNWKRGLFLQGIEMRPKEEN